MQWKGRRQSDNIEDVRNQTGGSSSDDLFNRTGLNFPSGSGVRLPRMSFRMMVILAIGYLVLKAMGIDALQLLDQTGLNGSPGREMSDGQSRQLSATDDEARQFVATILADTESTWTGIFQSMGRVYEQPKLVLFSGQYPSACGQANEASGPFYCPGDRKIYLDMAFFNQLSRDFGASGDFAHAYVVAHEVGHHVQNLLGVLPKFNKMRQAMNAVDANRLSVQVELQADCYAGIWGRFTEQQGFLQTGDLEEALNAANQIGDDTLQKKTQGYVVPDSFNHGTSAQRVKWFKRGFETGKVSACDTFSNGI
jgi:predicted metalloprotease